MTITLTKEEKTQIIESHIRSLTYNKYNLEIDLIQEEAKSAPNSGSVSALETQISDIAAQLVALNAELATVNALSE